jgi:hypothetical protein
VFLIGGFVLAAICHPQRRAYFTSLAPWVSIGVGFAALAPHLHWLATTGAMPFTYALGHTGKAFGPALIEALLFMAGIALVLAIPAVAWVMIAGYRLNKFSHDFRAMDPGLLLLFLVSVGTIGLPMLTCVWLGTDMPPIWALQGLFLFAILIVCGTSYSIERFYSVNLAVLVIAIAMVAVFVVAPAHALYRNTHPLNEGRNFYRLSAMELTRQWRQQSDVALPIVGGDDDLTFAMAFYSPDHPVYDWRLVHPNSEKLPLQTTFKQGWAALCFAEDWRCIASMESAAARTSRYVRSEFAFQSAMLGIPGATQRFTALIVPPDNDGTIAPSPPTVIAEDIGASRRIRSRTATRRSLLRDQVR